MPWLWIRGGSSGSSGSGGTITSDIPVVPHTPAVLEEPAATPTGPAAPETPAAPGSNTAEADTPAQGPEGHVTTLGDVMPSAKGIPAENLTLDTVTQEENIVSSLEDEDRKEAAYVREAAKGETAPDSHIYAPENSVNLEGIAMDEAEFVHQQYLQQHPEAAGGRM